MDIRTFFSPPSAKQKSSGAKSGGNRASASEEKRSHKIKRKGSESSSPEVKNTRRKYEKKERNPKAKRAVVLSDSEEDEEFVSKKQKKPNHAKVKVIKDSDSEEDPLPHKIRKATKKIEKAKSGKSMGKKSTYFDVSDEEESPVKPKKSTVREEKPKVVKPVSPAKPKTPEKQKTTAADFFGSAPVHRSAKKLVSGKRKQPVEDEPVHSALMMDTKTEVSGNGEVELIQHPPKKRKEEESSPLKKKRKEEESSPLKKKSPVKESKSSLSSKLSKAAAASKTLVPETPPPARKSPSPAKPVKVTPAKKPKTPEKDDPPPSLEKKKSSYKSYMSREGPKALGSKAIPQGQDNSFEGMTFVITGVLESIERDEAQDLIQRYGGKVTQAVSKRTSYLLSGREPGQTKVAKAETLGTKQIDEDAFIELIRTTPGRKSSYQPSPEPATKKTIAKESGQPAPKKLKASPATSSQGEALSSQNSEASPMTQSPTSSPSRKEESLMWVDKYKPHSVKQIIGQQGDKSNMRKLLNWVRNWRSNRTKTHPKTSFFHKDQDGAISKAALLSGPPGVGKTTTAELVCQELGYSSVEMNASDSRNKKALEQVVSELLSNKSMDAFIGGSKGSHAENSAINHVLIMDEVDGMSGNEDRGGMQELISLIKTSKIPIICMCNDRNSSKIRSLANYCFDLRFQRPRVEQIKGAMLSVAFKEGLKIPPPAMDQIIIGANQDIRQVLHNMSMWTATHKSLTYDQAKEDASKAHKDIKTGPFDAVRKLLSVGESSKLSLIDKSDLFFCDYSIMPLFVQENYLAVGPAKAGGDIKKILELVSRTADSICDGDLVERLIRSGGSWSLLPMQAMLSSVIPSHFISGGLGQRIEFPRWLGKNSKRGRLDRVLQELQTHMRISTSADKASVNLDYVPHLRNALTVPLAVQDASDIKARVSSVIELLDAYHLTREDWDLIMEAGLFEGHRDPMASIPSKVKAAFTRAYNKEQHKTPYSLKGAPAKSRGKGGGGGGGPDVESQDPEGEWGNNNEEEEGDSIENSAMIVKSKKPKAGASGKDRAGKTEQSRESSKGKGKGKGKGRSGKS